MEETKSTTLPSAISLLRRATTKTMVHVETYIADYTDPVQAKTVSDLLNGYSLDQFGSSAPLDDDVRAQLCVELAKIPGAFSVVATIDNEPIGLINCFQGFSTFKCKPLVNIHDVFVVPEYRRKGVTQAMMGKVEEVGIATSHDTCLRIPLVTTLFDNVFCCPFFLHDRSVNTLDRRLSTCSSAVRAVRSRRDGCEE